MGERIVDRGTIGKERERGRKGDCERDRIRENNGNGNGGEVPERRTGWSG